MKSHVFVVSTKPVPGQDAEYNLWYDTRHIPDVLAVPGIVSARRFKATVDNQPQYLALYEIETDDADGVMAEIEARAGTERMPMSPALDPNSISAVLYEALAPVQPFITDDLS